MLLIGAVMMVVQAGALHFDPPSGFKLVQTDEQVFHQGPGGLLLNPPVTEKTWRWQDAQGRWLMLLYWDGLPPRDGGPAVLKDLPDAYPSGKNRSLERNSVTFTVARASQFMGQTGDFFVCYVISTITQHHWILYTDAKRMTQTEFLGVLDRLELKP
jgi:hypothetical protein